MGVASTAGSTCGSANPDGARLSGECGAAGEVRRLPAELAAQLDPEEWHRILERFFEILTEGVHRFEGTVNQYTGDGIMALFGAPLAHEGHAQRACRVSLQLQGERG